MKAEVQGQLAGLSRLIQEGRETATSGQEFIEHWLGKVEDKVRAVEAMVGKELASLAQVRESF
jgi:hypothetical protein